ncbi:MAG: protoporphyrinogen oxidase, partial [Kiloniellales bacterium]
EFTARVVDPLVGGLFAGTAEGLSMAAVFPALVDLERRHGSITRALVRRRRAGATMPGRRLFSWRDGVGTLPRVLVERLGPALKMGIAVRRIRRSAHGFRIEAGAAGAFDARAVVLATQPHVAASLLEGIDDAGADAAASISAPPIAVVFLGYRRDQVAHPLDGVGYLTPRGEGRALSGAQFSSTMFAGRAPAGHVALAGYIGGARAPDLALEAPADLIQLTRAEFRELLGASGEPLVARVRQWPRGLPQYAPGHGARIDALVSVGQRQPGLFMTGNYLNGVSVSACLTRSVKAAASVHEFLRGLARGNRSSIPVGSIAAR